MFWYCKYLAAQIRLILSSASLITFKAVIALGILKEKQSKIKKNSYLFFDIIMW